MSKPTKAQLRVQALERFHSMYGDVAQHTSEADDLMGALGHPFTNDFKMLLTVFNGLKYAAGHGERYIAYKDDTHFATMKCPGLDVDDDPVRHRRATDYESLWKMFGDASPTYPGNWEGYLKYIEKCGELKWPEVCGPALDVEFDVQTFDYRIMADLFKIMKGRVSIDRAYGPNGHKDKDQPFRFNVSRYDRPTGKESLMILALIGRKMRRWVIEPRTQTDDIMDAMPVELPQKKWMLANVERLTVTDHHIQVPLMPMDNRPTSRAMMEDTANGIVRLVEQGYPWEPSARQWCEQFLTAAGFRQLDRKYKKRVATV